MADPMHQFEIQKVLDLPAITLPGIGAIDMSITNSTVAMLLAAALVVVFFAVTTAKAAVVPGRLQVIVGARRREEGVKFGRRDLGAVPFHDFGPESQNDVLARMSRNPAMTLLAATTPDIALGEVFG